MKVVFIGHSGAQYPHTRVRCYGFAKALEAHGIETEVLSFKDHLAEHLREEDMYAALRDRDKMALVLRATGRLLKHRGDLLYIQKAHFHSAAPWLLHRYLGAKYILDYDDYDVPLSNFFARGRWNRLFFGSNRWDTITEKLARGAVGCVVSSHGLEEYISPLNERQIRVETGVDTSRFCPPSSPRDPDAPLTYFWNGLVWGDEIFDSVAMAIRAFEKVYAKNSDTRLLIVGGGFQWDRLIEYCKDKYDHIPITLRGWFPPDAMPAVLREADVGLLPFARTNEWVKCKSPTKLFEYLATGLAVVADGTGEAAHVIQDGENGILASDEDEMTEAMLSLSWDEGLRKKISENAVRTAEEKYSMEVLGEKLAGFLKQFGV